MNPKDMALADAQLAVETFSRSYEELLKRHQKLPTLAELDHTTDILEYISRHRTAPRNMARFVRGHLLETINAWMGYLHWFVLPNQQNAVSMEEYGFVTDQERQKVIKVLNWNMYRNRDANLLQISEDDDRTVDFIISVFAEWKIHKETIVYVLDKSRATWKAKLEK